MVTAHAAHPGGAGVVASPGSHGLAGVLLVLEGIDGSGRTTQAARLEAALATAGFGVLTTGSGSSLLGAQSIQQSRRRERDPHVTALLDAAAVAERAELAILPALRAGMVVIADRYAWTPIARAIARGVDASWAEQLHADLVPPDAAFYLDLDPRTALARRRGELDRSGDGAAPRLPAKVRASYLRFGVQLAAAFTAGAGPWGFTHIDADGEINAVAARVLAAAEMTIAVRSGVAPR